VDDVEDVTAEEFEGQGDTFELALDGAWKKAKAGGKDPGWFKVKTMWVRGENPIREYRVIITPGG